MNPRNIYFDNAKFLLIFLVVLGHFLDLNRSIPIIGGVKNIIYSFHMPLFIFISGYFSRNINTQRKKEIDSILYIYFTFEIINFIYTSITTLGYGSYYIFRPTYQNWYILGLFIWRLLIPYFNFYSKKVLLFFAISISLSIGYIHDFNSFLGLYRIMYYLPFFIIGYYCDNIEQLLERFKRYKFYFFTLLALAFTAIFALSIFDRDYNKIISYAYTPFIGYRNNIDFFVRLVALSSSFILSFFVLFAIPSTKTFFTRFGKNTIVVFLLHMFFVFPLHAVLNKVNLHDVIKLIVIITSSLLITYTLSLDSIYRIMKPFLSLGNLRFLIKKSS